MREAKLIETRDVALGEIEVADRLRRASPSAVASIVASIEQLGSALAPVMLRRKGDRLILIGGLHRLEAYRALGRETIRADIWECSDDWARLAEIDENLAGADLSTLELSRFLAQRKALYEKLNPQTKAGTAGAAARWHPDANDTVSFASTIAEKRGFSRRKVERLVYIGRQLDIQAGALLAAHERETGRHVGYGELAALTKLSTSYQQADAVKWFLEEPAARSLKVASELQKDGRAARDGDDQPPHMQAIAQISAVLVRLSAADQRKVMGYLAKYYWADLRSARDEIEAGQ